MIGPSDLLHRSPAPLFKSFQIFLFYCPKGPNFSMIQSRVPDVTLYWFLPSVKVHLAGEKSFLLDKCCFCHGNPGFYFTCTSWFIGSQATQIVEIFHILQLFMVCHNLCWGWPPWDSL